nr:GGDEF domain-containing protein [uncultured Sphaerochaeta sp.]
MDYLIQFQINIFAFAILVILYLFMQKSRIKTFSKHLLNWSLLTTSIAIIDEPLTWIIDGEQFLGAFLLEYSTNFLLYLIGPVIGGLLMSYVDFRMFHDRKRVQKRWYYQHASLLTLFMLIMNTFLPLYFSVNPETNSYSSEPFKFIHYILLGLLYGYFFVFITMNRKKITRNETLIYQFFFFIPIAGMVLQFFNSKLHFSWTSIALALFVIYVFLESTPSDEDYLTKLYNRSSYDAYMQHLLQSNKQFSLIVFDLNYFKEINDKHGHEMGDYTLICFAKALKKAFAPRGLAFRLGGDEFAAISESGNVEAIIEMIKVYLHKNNNPLIKNLRFSYGYHSPLPGMTADELSNIADHKMYAQKQVMKENDPRGER